VDQYAQRLLDALDAAVPVWVVAQVDRLVLAYRGTGDPAVHDDAVAAAERARAEVTERLAQLLATDIDAQRTNPLAIVRAAVRHPTEVLRRAGVPEVVRDEFAERHFPDDVYDLSPAAWRDLGEDVHEAGLAWGAWKAKQHLDRRRGEGRR